MNGKINRFIKIFLSIFSITFFFLIKQTAFTQIINLNKFYTESEFEKYDSFIKKFAPSGDALIAIQRMAEPYIQKKQWVTAMKVFDRYRKLFEFNDRFFNKMITLFSEKESGIIIKNLGPGVNTANDEYNPVPTSDGKKLFFNSRNRFDSFGGEDIYISEYLNGRWQKSYNAGEEVNTNRNDFITGISVDGNRIIIMGSYFGSIGRSDLFYIDKKADGWNRLQHFPYPINTEYYESDGFLTSDGKALLLISDRPGGIGETIEKNINFHGDFWGNTDIYVSLLTDSGWSKPINLGDKINTPYAEKTPFLHPDGKTLYFSSDGYYGLGRLDLYKATRLSDTSWTEWSVPINLGKEINTAGNDYGYKINTTGDIAYLTKDSKEDGYGGSDIYSMSLPKYAQPTPVITVQGKVTDKYGNPLEAEIIWENLLSGEAIGKLKSDPVDGSYFFALPLGKKYGFFAQKEGYYPISKNITIKNKNQAQKIIENIYLPGLDTIITLNNIFFDYNKSKLKKESFPELKRLLNIIKANLGKTIEISGNTDNIGSNVFNTVLSGKRATAVKNYLVKYGCDESKITVKAYGKSRPIASNDTEEGRSKNRRVEFRFIKKAEISFPKTKVNLVRKEKTDIRVKNRIYTDGKFFSILYANREDEDTAIKDALQLKIKGYDAYVIKTIQEDLGEEWYEVRIGSLNSEKEAEDLLNIF